MITKQEIWRKVIHLSSLIYPLLYANFLEKSQIITIVSIISLLLIVTEVLRKMHFFNKFFCKIFAFTLRSKEMTARLGATYFMSGILLTIILFEKRLAITSMCVLVVSDTLASIVGISFGGKFFKQNIFASLKKSTEGFLAFAISCFCIINITFGELSIICIALISTLLALVEVVSQKMKIDDNFSIPLACATILYCVI